MTTQAGDATTHRLQNTEEKQISTFVDAVHLLLKSCAINSSIAKTMADVTCLKMASMETSIQVSDVLRSKVVRCKNAYPEERTKKAFIADLPASIQSAVRKFWEREQNAHLLKVAQYVNTVLEKTRQVPSHVLGPIWRNCFQRGRRKVSIVAAVAEQRFESPRDIYCITKNARETFLSKRGIYASGYKTEQATRCRLSVAKDHKMKTCLYTVCSRKLAQKEKANYK